MAKVIANHTIKYEGKNNLAGTVLDLEEALANSLVESRAAKRFPVEDIQAGEGGEETLVIDGAAIEAYTYNELKTVVAELGLTVADQKTDTLKAALYFWLESDEE